MFYRRKVILALLDVFGGKLEKLRIQKLIFLLSQEQKKPEYDFIPFKYGCYSHSLSADLSAMIRNGWLYDDGTGISKKVAANYVSSLKDADRSLLLSIKKKYEGMDGNALMRYTYLNYPYFAINSLKANDILDSVEIQKVKQAKPKNNKVILFTIGYEGISLEEYLNRLIINNVQVLIDVRRNPISMKYGFSKTSLERFCKELEIKYVHFPEVGIESNQRRELNNQSDYDSLFREYKLKNLTKTGVTQTAIIDILKSNERIALTCFEANICQCHRKVLADAIAARPDFKYELKHI